MVLIFVNKVHYYTCANLDPRVDSSQNLKIPAIIEIISIFLHIFVKLKILQHKTCANTDKSSDLKTFEHQTIADFTSTIIGVACFAIFSLLSVKTNSLINLEINQFPNFIYLHVFQLFIPYMVVFAICFVNYARCRPLRQTIVRELKDLMAREHTFACFE